MPAGKTSRLLLSKDRLLVCERKAFTIAPSPPISASMPIVYRHVFIAMEMWYHVMFSPTHFYEACAQLRFCTASS